MRSEETVNRRDVAQRAIKAALQASETAFTITPSGPVLILPMYKTDDDHPDRMRRKAQQLREKARVADMPGYAEQLIRAAEDLEKYADELEDRSLTKKRN